MNENYISLKAQECSSFSSEGVVDPFTICANLGIRVCSNRSLSKDGYFIRDWEKKLILINSKIGNHRRRRFVLSHEIGHYFLHPKEMIQTCTDIRESFNRYSRLKNMEAEANFFASELLSPKRLIRTRLKDQPITFELVKKLADEFDVSVTSLAIKCVENSYSESELLICYENRALKWFTSANPDWEYHMIPGGCPPESLVSECFDSHSFEIRAKRSRNVWSNFDGYVSEQVFPVSDRQKLVIVTGIQREFV